MRNEASANRALDLYADTIRRICFIHLKNYADVDDVFQEVFLKYLLHDNRFESDAHEKAWLIRVALNASKDVLKGFFRRNVTTFDELFYEPFYLQEQEYEVMDAVLMNAGRNAATFGLAALCSVILLFTVASGFSYNLIFTPTTYVDMDINPSIGLTLNRFD